MGIIAATDTFPAKIMAILHSVSQKPTEVSEKIYEREIGELNLTTS